MTGCTGMRETVGVNSEKLSSEHLVGRIGIEVETQGSEFFMSIGVSYRVQAAGQWPYVFGEGHGGIVLPIFQTGVPLHEQVSVPQHLTSADDVLKAHWLVTPTCFLLFLLGHFGFLV